MISIEELTVKDLPYLEELTPEGWTDIIEPHTFFINSSFCQPLKFLMNGQIIGLGTIIFHKSTAWLAQIIVRKENRNEGLGTYITQILIDLINKNKYKTISLIATQLGEPVYKKLGFKTQVNYLSFNKKNSEKFVIENSNFVVNYLEFDNAILKMDKANSGENRAALLKPHLSGAIVFINNSTLLGFYLPTLFNGLIVATEKESGLTLIKIRLNVFNAAMLPENNFSAIEFLKNEGLTKTMSLPRMYLGNKINFKPEQLFNRISGALG